MLEPLTPQQFLTAEGAEDWRILADGANAYFRTGSLAAGARLTRAISELPGIDDHPPAIDVRHDGVTVRLVTFTEDIGGLTRRDLDLAGQISALARDLGYTADPSKVQSLLLVPGAADTSAIQPFWHAVLGYEPRPDSPEEDLIDPRDRGLPVWFEQMEQLRGDGGGSIHLAVWIPEEQAEARVAADREWEE